MLGSTVCHAPDRVYGWRGSMAAARQTPRHAHDEWVRHPIQCVMVILCAAIPAGWEVLACQ
ncbi:MAG: hypothetical protein D6716_02110 [Chloroflexi bacterium]|nr:MAG: hypothetical protein D6716_02110 [Chloroflexota bacterium]